MDDSGSRDPDRTRTTDPDLVDWFGLGGIIVREEDVSIIDSEVGKFRSRWPHPDAPLHSWEIRAQKDGFAWLRKASAAKRLRFMEELSELMCSLPIIVHAAVVDRPGYNKRYLTEYGPRRWSLAAPLSRSPLSVRRSSAARRARGFAFSSNKPTKLQMRR